MIHARNAKVKFKGSGRELLSEYVLIGKKLKEIMPKRVVDNAEKILEKEKLEAQILKNAEILRRMEEEEND